MTDQIIKCKDSKSASGTIKPLYSKIIVLAGLLSLACSTRVSEWMILNAIPGNYSLIYFHNETVSDNVIKQHLPLRQLSTHANLEFSVKLSKEIEKPYYALYYKKRLFAKYTSYNELRDLTTSSLRKKIADELLDGKLCVMLYLKVGDDTKDKRGMSVIQNTINSSPFKDIITLVEIDRKSIEEAHFISFLLNVEDDLKQINEPMLFGIFGRFKALEPLLAGGISEENINHMIDYLTAECSCIIKDNLPGTDILFSGNWENPEPALLNKIIDENPSLVW